MASHPIRQHPTILVEVKSGRVINKLPDSSGWSGLKWTPDGKAMTAKYGGIQMWNRITGEPESKLIRLTIRPETCNFHPEGHTLIAGTEFEKFRASMGHDFVERGRPRYSTKVLFSNGL